MCNACGTPAGAGPWTEAGLATPRDRFRARLRQAAVLARVLRPYGLIAGGDGMTEGIVLSTLTGASVIVADPARLWPEAERLAGRRIDPLDV